MNRKCGVNCQCVPSGLLQDRCKGVLINGLDGWIRGVDIWVGGVFVDFYLQWIGGWVALQTNMCVCAYDG